VPTSVDAGQSLVVCARTPLTVRFAEDLVSRTGPDQQPPTSPTQAQRRHRDRTQHPRHRRGI